MREKVNFDLVWRFRSTRCAAAICSAYAAGTAEEEAQQGPYLYQPSESRSARVICRAGSPARSESSAFSRQARLQHTTCLMAVTIT